ncbi:tetratricopeptide repeat protein [Pontibacter cellulosilyticus]|uniref:Tetratricopeptide repeat protein n=1 Tax=Pontibacter cellulosilyticus TaxID=1720253 RepID=A0A923SJ74_9BACT|nr:tetratricopeptide repeat protein [Pontibacter cellulosilyticus]MBC5992426.1 tetratricopeptide repeat protein [Pontibacter cellulosilyticus]
MTITHQIDDFLFELFPKAKAAENSKGTLKEEMSRYYTIGPFVPSVIVKGDTIEVTLDSDLIDEQHKEYQTVVALAEKGRYNEAKQRLLPLLEKAPHISEYHRILGQIQSEEGDQDEAINSLIDALRWDPKNGYALLMMGNIFARHKKDIDTALTYYAQAAKVNPEDNITLNNIGAILVQSGRVKEGIDYLLSAKDLAPEYPNTYFALAMAEESQGSLLSAFDYAVGAIKKSKGSQLYSQSVECAIDLAGRLVAHGKGDRIVAKYTAELQQSVGTTIEVVEDDSIATAAKIEFAENYNRDRHIIRYKPSYSAVQHLIMHELVHLDLVAQARKEQKNQLFTSGPSHSTAFNKAMDKDVKRLRKEGIPEDSVMQFLSSIFNGLNLQVYNTPIDLFIEDYLYSTYKELRPYQFLSLMRIVQEGVNATTDKRIASLAPRLVLSASKVYNLVNALHLKDLYGVDYTTVFNATAKETKQAEEFIEEFEEYRYDRDAAEEYELVQHWADDLDLGDFFALVQENSFRKGKSPEDLIAEMEQDALGTDEADPYEEEQMQTFLKEHQNKDLNMAVVMYMVDALKYFGKLSKEKVKTIAHDIAMKGMYGISPEKSDYSIASIPGKTFTGYHLLAYYYVSWAIAEPAFLKELQLPFDKEYVVAQQFKQEK